jgi:hypothetical protein
MREVFYEVYQGSMKNKEKMEIAGMNAAGFVKFYCHLPFKKFVVTNQRF